jgi:hypothetical protein
VIVWHIKCSVLFNDTVSRYYHRGPLLEWSGMRGWSGGGMILTRKAGEMDERVTCTSRKTWSCLYFCDCSVRRRPMKGKSCVVLRFVPLCLAACRKQAAGLDCIMRFIELSQKVIDIRLDNRNCDYGHANFFFWSFVSQHYVGRLYKPYFRITHDMFRTGQQ